MKMAHLSVSRLLNQMKAMENRFSILPLFFLFKQLCRLNKKKPGSYRRRQAALQFLNKNS